MIQQTTALRKIARLKKRIWVIQGGQGAGKTFSILILICNYAQSNPDREIFIASAELTKMRITVIKDFVKIMKEVGIYDPTAFTSGTFYRFKNGSFIKFIGLDKEDIGKGLRSDLVFINEANKVPFETYREMTSRAKRVILDFNPNAEFWVHTEILTRNDAEFLALTYRDNELLSIQERQEIEMMKFKAYHDPHLERYDFEANIKSKYWRNKWNIYGLGVMGFNPNRIFNWKEISEADYLKIQAKKYYGVDWGKVDPWGILEAKYLDGALYLKELNYASENELMAVMTPDQLGKLRDKEEGIVAWQFERLGIPKNAIIVCDDNRAMKIVALRQAGWDYAIAAAKGPGCVLDGIGSLEQLDVYFTASSNNLRKEQESYSRITDRYGVVLEEPEDANSHLIDPTRYIVAFLKQQGVIKLI